MFCYGARGRGDSDSCNAKEGNPFGPFWDTFDIDFDSSVFHGPLLFNAEDPNVANSWHTQ